MAVQISLLYQSTLLSPLQGTSTPSPDFRPNPAFPFTPGIVKMPTEKLTFQSTKQLNYFQILIWPVWYQLSTESDVSCFIKYSVYKCWAYCWKKYCLGEERRLSNRAPYGHSPSFHHLMPQSPLPQSAWLTLYNCFFLLSNYKIF